ncbi:Gag-Pol polyprotein [Plakobranchus ocellatus]|uniref:ribonuclease H n=1 Tax=Plakobranchus ocellatus TaxID=259542 RepID=A0AAV4BGX4_9GAST|nr:Gag-Pol polyprotein [Plakobranchus ocellatus]
MFGACGATCSNYDAETIAIRTAVEHLNLTFEEDPTKIDNIIIFSDSKAALQALENNHKQNNEILSTKLIINQVISTYAIQLVLQWIPGHTNITGNEKADRLSKKGSQQAQPHKPIPFQTAKQIIKNNYREDWMNMWAMGKSGRAMYRHMNSTKPKDDIRSIPRKDQATIFRLRTEHAPLNQHLNRTNPEHPPMCPLCNHQFEAVPHLLLHCPNLQDLRKQLLPTAPDINKTLYSNREQLMKTSTYYFMAMGRRAAAQRPLDY